MQIVWFDAIGPTEEAMAGGRILGAVMRVFSHGTVRLRSNDPYDDPVVDFNLLTDERDLVRLRDCVYRLADLVHHPEIAEHIDSATALATPLDDLVVAGDAAIDMWLHENVTDYVHAVGTCRMGAPGDPAAVVDTDCRAIGYDGIRVCDASVMPDLPKANTHLTTVAIADTLATRMLA
jgi:choline dehydrogenase-like flavoprotein